MPESEAGHRSSAPPPATCPLTEAAPRSTLRRMRRFARTVHKPGGVAGLEMVGRDARPGTLPLGDHSHTGTEICHVASGEVVWMLGRRRMHLVGGMISMVPPGVAHHGEMDVIAPSDLYWVIFRADRMQPPLPRAIVDILTRGEPYAVSGDGPFPERFDAILDECSLKRPGWPAAAAAHLALLATEAARLSPALHREGRGAAPPPVMEAARILAGNLEAPPSIRELARRVGLGPTRFHALFRQAMGLTPRDYVGRLRLTEARRALSGSAEDITELALRLGYPSSQYFATVFRKHTGLTPSAFRAREC